jgi:hypothetical protein
VIDALCRQLQGLMEAAGALDDMLHSADPASLTPLDVVQATVDLAELCEGFDRLAERLANAAELQPGPCDGPRRSTLLRRTR